MNIVQKIFYDPGNGYIINIKFISFNKKQQQVEWPFKLGEPYLVSRCIHTI